MALPSKLKNFNLFNNGNNYLGQVSEITLCGREHFQQRAEILVIGTQVEHAGTAVSI